MTEQVGEIDRHHADASFRAGVTAGMLLLIGASAVHWMITPVAHPTATDLDRVGNAVQLLAGFGGALFVTYRHNRRTAFGQS
jgi:hypothetical protein